MTMPNIKLAFLNVLSWLATFASLQAVKDWLQLAAILGSIGVSLASVWWIRKQARSLDKRDADKP